MAERGTEGATSHAQGAGVTPEITPSRACIVRESRMGQETLRAVRGYHRQATTTAAGPREEPMSRSDNASPKPLRAGRLVDKPHFASEGKT